MLACRWVGACNSGAIRDSASQISLCSPTVALRLFQFVSAIEALLLVCLSIFQVYYLRSLFTDKPNR